MVTMPHLLKCQECGTTFNSKWQDTKYCSRKCYVKAIKKLYAKNKPKKPKFQKQVITNTITLKQVLEYLKKHPEILKNQPLSLSNNFKQSESYGLCLLCKKQFPESKLYVYKQDSNLEFCEECYKHHFREVSRIIRKSLQNRKVKFT